MIKFNSNKITTEHKNASEILAMAIMEKFAPNTPTDTDLYFDATMYASGNQNAPSAYSDEAIGNGLKVTINYSHPIFSSLKFNKDGEFEGRKISKKNAVMIIGTYAQALALSTVEPKDRFYGGGSQNGSGSNKKIRAKAEVGTVSGRDAMESFGLKLASNRRGFEIVDVETYKQIAEEFADEIETIRKLKISDDYTPRVQTSDEAKPKNIKVICDTDEDCTFMNAVKSFVIENGKASVIKGFHCPNGHLLIDATNKTEADVVTEAEEILATA